jgi:transposase
MKTFGLIIPKGTGRVFDGNVRELLDGNDGLARIILPLLEAWRDIRKRAADLDHQLLAAARESQEAKLLMTIPGIGAVTAVSYVAAVEDPENFKTSRSVGAWLGLTTRRYQSGEVDYDGHISRRGDNHLRGLLYEAATVILTRTSAKTESSLKIWGLKLRERLGFKRAAVAVARKLAVIMHGMLKTGEVFNAVAGATA